MFHDPILTTCAYFSKGLVTNHQPDRPYQGLLGEGGGPLGLEPSLGTLPRFCMEMLPLRVGWFGNGI